MRRLYWSPDLQSRLGHSLGDDAADIAHRITAGELIALEWGGELLTVVALEGSEFVMVCMAGSGLMKYIDVLLVFAKNTGAKSLRYHSNRAGIQRILKALDFEPQGLDGSGQMIYKALL